MAANADSPPRPLFFSYSPGLFLTGFMDPPGCGPVTINSLHKISGFINHCLATKEKVAAS